MGLKAICHAGSACPGRDVRSWSWGMVSKGSRGRKWKLYRREMRNFLVRAERLSGAPLPRNFGRLNRCYCIPHCSLLHSYHPPTKTCQKATGMPSGTEPIHLREMPDDQPIPVSCFTGFLGKLEMLLLSQN